MVNTRGSIFVMPNVSFLEMLKGLNWIGLCALILSIPLVVSGLLPNGIFTNG